jgi:hypothetical protein
MSYSISLKKYKKPKNLISNELASKIKELLDKYNKPQEPKARAQKKKSVERVERGRTERKEKEEKKVDDSLVSRKIGEFTFTIIPKREIVGESRYRIKKTKPKTKASFVKGSNYKTFSEAQVALRKLSGKGFQIPIEELVKIRDKKYDITKPLIDALSKFI